MAPRRRTRPDHVEMESGLFPRHYRSRLRDAEGGFCATSEYDALSVFYGEASPFIGTAVHTSHNIRPDILPNVLLSDEGRYREEDPETHQFTGMLAHQILPNQSRYEFDLNRPPDTTIYKDPSLAWGQEVWREPLNQWEREFTLEKWYEFHTFMDCAVEDAIERFGYAVVFDFHSYNYQRDGPTDWRKDGKPVINLGTRHLNVDEKGRGIVDRFMDSICKHTVLGEEALIEENGVFYGGYLNRRLSHLYGPKAITLSVEYKKVFMDEINHVVYADVLQDLVAQMDESIQALGEWLGVPVRQQPEVPRLDTGWERQTKTLQAA